MDYRKIDAASKHLVEIAKAEHQTKQAWGKEWAKLKEKRIELQRYQECRQLLEKLLPNWRQFDGNGLITSFLITERTK